MSIIMDTLYALSAIAVFVALMVAAGTVADRLHPFTACVVGGTLIVGILFLFAWREEGRR